MRLRIYLTGALTETQRGEIAKWKFRMQKIAPEIEFIEGAAGAHRWAPWTGEPFVLAGPPEMLGAYVESLRTSERDVLLDHQYFWLLTEGAWQHSFFARARRTVALNWQFAEQNLVYDRLLLLNRMPRLRGLGRRMHIIREDILRIASGPLSPGFSVLISGGTGVGKEEIAQSLHELCPRGATGKAMEAVTGAWLNMEPGMALTEVLGLEQGRASGVQEFPGLVELHSTGTLFFDDFESAPRNVQEALLRIMASLRGTAARYRRVGGRIDRYTSVWLIFATNTPIDKLIRSEQLREDVLYRFEDRVLVMTPLRERPADLPAIALAIWNQLWAADETRKVPLAFPVIRAIAERGLKWEGNVRTLRALLSLVVSMRCNPAHNASSPGELVDEVLLRGATYREWVRVIESEFFHTGEPLAVRIRQADSAANCQGPSRAGDPLETDLTPSETEARGLLTAAGWELFRKLVAVAPRTRGSDGVRVSVRLARVVCYVAEAGSISWEIAGELSNVVENTAIGDLAALSNHELKDARKRIPRNEDPALLHTDPSGGKARYARVDVFFA